MGSNFDLHSRQVGLTEISRYTVSTIFVGCGHAFETAIIDNYNAEETIITGKYSTWEEAETGHQKAVNYIQST